MSNPIINKFFGIVQMKRRGSITIGKEIRKTLNLADEGDLFEIRMKNGCIVLEPKKLISSDQIMVLVRGMASWWLEYG